jgi:hypothetical protein
VLKFDDSFFIASEFSILTPEKNGTYLRKKEPKSLICLPVYVNLLGSGTSVPHYGEAKASLPIKFHLFLVSEISGKKLK